MDHGHPIAFGTFITPSADDPAAPVELARVSERLGYEYATFQDHPYQPRFLDTWTLMSYVAAATTTIGIAPNVLNLPLRPAPVLAGAAASLDLLSGGRLSLGLGAGGFWDAIEAMGVPRLTPGQAVDALDEAIDLIRDLWAVGERGIVHGGEHYPVHGAQRGPAPAHEVPIWLGAYKPRMLRLTGAKADGWLPSLSYLEPGALHDGNARIDDAAADAGRAPGDIRRLLNIRGNEPVEELVGYAVEEGVSVFIVGGDDPEAMRRFAESSAPAVREAVAAERATSGATASSRTSVALAQRRDGIAYDDVPTSLRDRAIEPGDFAYRTVRSTYMRGGAPGLVLRPQSVEEVVDAVGFAKTHRDLPMSLRSGGHGISGRSTNDGGLVIDLGALRDVTVVDAATRRVRLGPGARWMEVAAVLDPHGWALSSGDFGGVGVGGLATAGGIGFLGREYGLTIDRMVAAEIVLADGSVVRASEDENADLFWAVRGAGANVGAVVAFEFEAAPVTEVGWAQLAFDVADPAAFLSDFGRTMEASPRDTTLFLILAGQGGRLVAQVYGVVDAADPETIIARLQPFAEIAPLVGQSVVATTYASVMANAALDAQHDGQGEPQFRSGLVRHFDDEVAAAAGALVASGATPWFQVRSVGGAVNDVPADATAYAHREANFSVTAVGAGPTFDRLWADLADHFDGLYASFETRRDPSLLEQAFPPATLARLREVKRRHDPGALFVDNFAVPVA